MQLFFCPGIRDNQRFLDPEESHHCVKVLRKQAGDLINVTDGAGTLYEAQITELNKKRCAFSVNSSKEVKRPEHRILIGIAPTKSAERVEWFVEKVVEIGIDRIIFIHSEHAERPFLNLERIKKKSISAMKQSLRTYLPEIDPLLPLEDVIRQSTNIRYKFVAHLEDQNQQHLADIAVPGNEVLILIGPEGGFSDSEMLMLKQNGFTAVKIGDYRLRTETAGIVACSLLNDLNRP